MNEAEAVALSGLRCECCGRTITRGELVVLVLTATGRYYLCPACEGLLMSTCHQEAE
jgi:hypothetical protein